MRCNKIYHYNQQNNPIAYSFLVILIVLTFYSIVSDKTTFLLGKMFMVDEPCRCECEELWREERWLTLIFDM